MIATYASGHKNTQGVPAHCRLHAWYAAACCKLWQLSHPSIIPCPCDPHVCGFLITIQELTHHPRVGTRWKLFRCTSFSGAPEGYPRKIASSPSTTQQRGPSQNLVGVGELVWLDPAKFIHKLHACRPVFRLLIHTTKVQLESCLATFFWHPVHSHGSLLEKSLSSIFFWWISRVEFSCLCILCILRSVGVSAIATCSQRVRISMLLQPM
jgi:hypothetical protein